MTLLCFRTDFGVIAINYSETSGEIRTCYCCVWLKYVFFSLSDPQLLLFLKAFTETEQTKLAMLSGILLANGTLPATILTSLFTDNIVKEGNFLYVLIFLH